jgi:competence protein ComFB
MRNVVEALASRVYEELLPTFPDSCGCLLCREDVLVYALNRIPPHYVATVTGEALSNIAMEAGQGRADIAVALMDAFRVVAASPRHPRKAGQAP